MASVACGLCQQAQLGPVLKYGVAAVMVVAHVAVNILQWVADLVAIVEKQLEFSLATPTQYALVAQAAALNYAEAQTDSLALLLTTEQVPIQLVYVPAVGMVEKAVVSMLYPAVIIAVQ